MNPLNLCIEIVGLELPKAEEAIKLAGCTARVTYDAGQIILANVTSDFVETRINLRLDRGMIKHARVG